MKYTVHELICELNTIPNKNMSVYLEVNDIYHTLAKIDKNVMNGSVSLVAYGENINNKKENINDK